MHDAAHAYAMRQYCADCQRVTDWYRLPGQAPQCAACADLRAALPRSVIPALLTLRQRVASGLLTEYPVPDSDPRWEPPC